MTKPIIISGLGWQIHIFLYKCFTPLYFRFRRCFLFSFSSFFLLFFKGYLNKSYFKPLFAKWHSWILWRAEVRIQEICYCKSEFSCTLRRRTCWEWLRVHQLILSWFNNTSTSTTYSDVRLIQAQLACACTCVREKKTWSMCFQEKSRITWQLVIYSSYTGFPRII